MAQLPLELISNLISLIILVMIFVKYYQYKKKLDVLKELNELKEKKKLTSEDKSFIKTNLKDYQVLFARDEQRIKLAYPVFILIAGVLLAFLDFKEAMIHLNVIVVAFIFMQVNKIHNRNFINFLTALDKGN
ncbi:hypothetical protein [Halarcobacter bivalviorum]|uniref:Membrane protein n=1 Tax=Halarcobacter bivalviorum TaxID=663364 RepID=A0AAX2A6F4_9BACT|nr:hypothetical protein [Halarcobacter bivalviorum]AXH13552.1 putative membrane protein [Halarcobacter bivalviorum]RXK09842.1 hypothetical protein CRV05_08920 [Halarcobacter bivalviorum]